LKRRCPICKERGIAPWRGFGRPVRCSACGRYFKLARTGLFLWAAPIWLVLAIGGADILGLALLLGAIVAITSAIAQPWSWWSAGCLAVLLYISGVPAVIPLREVEAPDPNEIQYSRHHRALQYFLIALPFLQFVLPFVGRTNYQTNVPVAVALAAIAAGVIVYCAVLHGRYFYYRGVKRAGFGGIAPSPLPSANLFVTLVFPVVWAWLSLTIFHLQLRRDDGSLREIGLISLAAVAVLTLSLLACYWAGTRRRPSRLVFH
jgi:uncharacterized protein (DUF983 family)